MQRPSENELIETYFAPLAGPGGLGLRDDAAILVPPSGCDVVLTTDVVVAGVHFFPDDPPALVAKKALRVNLSDLAGKGAKPLGYLLGLTMPDSWTVDWIAAFSDGLRQDGATYDCPLLGGDTSWTPGPLMISITALGTVPARQMVRRGGAAPGDSIYVTGTIGDAALGLALRKDEARARPWTRAMSASARAFLDDRYLLPQPRLGLEALLRQHAHAAMDVSDGLAGDLSKMLRLAGLTAEISIAEVPLSEAAREAIALEPALVETIVCGGDDYEILCAVPPDLGTAFEAAARAGGIPVRAIGTSVPGRAPPVFQDAEGRQLSFMKTSYQHF